MQRSSRRVHVDQSKREMRNAEVLRIGKSKNEKLGSRFSVGKDSSFRPTIPLDLFLFPGSFLHTCRKDEEVGRKKKIGGFVSRDKEIY